MHLCRQRTCTHTRAYTRGPAAGAYLEGRASALAGAPVVAESALAAAFAFAASVPASAAAFAFAASAAAFAFVASAAASVRTSAAASRAVSAHLLSLRAHDLA